MVPVVTVPASWSLLTCVDRIGSRGWCRAGEEGNRLEGAACAAGGAILASRTAEDPSPTPPHCLKKRPLCVSNPCGTKPRTGFEPEARKGSNWRDRAGDWRG